jgi:polysaccharide biosynthesis protein PslE
MANQLINYSTPFGIWNLIWRHKKKVVVCPMLAIAVGAVALLYFPRSYRSQSQIFLRMGRESVGLDPTATTGQTISLHQGDRKDEVKSVMEVVKSRGVIEQVVDRLGPDVVMGHGGDSSQPNKLAAAIKVPLHAAIEWYQSIDPISDRERAIVVVERHLFAWAERGSTLIDVTYEAKTPQLAQKICAEVVDVYQQEHMRIQRSDESRPFFAEQQERLRQQLDSSLNALRDAKNQMGLTDVTDRRATLEAQFSAVELDRLSAQQQLATSQARIADLEKQLAQLPERLVASKKSVPNVGADLLRDQLYSLEVKSMDLRARYKDNHPLVKAINEQLKDAQEVLALQSGERVETTDDLNPIHRELSLALKQERSVSAGLQARLAMHDQQSAVVLAELRLLNGHELKIDQLSRDADLAREKFYQYAKNFEEARIDKELERDRISNLSIVQKATLSERPVSPSKPLLAAATLLFAIFGTAAIVLGSEWMHQPRTIGANGAAEMQLPRSSAIRMHRRVIPAKTNGHTHV